MKLPRLVITTFARKCHQKYVDIKDYMEPHQVMTAAHYKCAAAVQLERLECMASSLEAQWHQMTWYSHNSMVDPVNTEFLLKLASQRPP